MCTHRWLSLTFDTAGKGFTRQSIADKNTFQKAERAASGGTAVSPSTVAEVIGREAIRSADLPAVSLLVRATTTVPLEGTAARREAGGDPE